MQARENPLPDHTAAFLSEYDPGPYEVPMSFLLVTYFSKALYLLTKPYPHSAMVH